MTNRNYIDLQLKRIKAFLGFIGNPQEKYKSIIVGGTNGKGSTCFYLSNLINSYSNLKVGRYTSPHLISWEERFTINEKIIKKEILNKIKKEIEEKLQAFEDQNKKLEKLTEFEIYTAIAFRLFEKEKVDIAILEVGLGGRLDATNVVSSQNTICSIITNISLDHTHILGKTIKKIAFEKSGIIKNKNIIFTGASSKALNTIKKAAKEKRSKLVSVKQDEKETYKEKNIKLTLKAWKYISKELNIKKKKESKLKKILKSISPHCRLEYFKNENILLDGAHNPAAAIELKRYLDKQYKNCRISYIVGFLNKDYKTFLKNLQIKNNLIICVEPNSHRATDKELVLKEALKYSSNSFVNNSLKNAIKTIRKLDNNLMVITGSLYLVGESLKLLRDKTKR